MASRAAQAGPCTAVQVDEPQSSAHGESKQKANAPPSQGKQIRTVKPLEIHYDWIGMTRSEMERLMKGELISESFSCRGFHDFNWPGISVGSQCSFFLVWRVRSRSAGELPPWSSNTGHPFLNLPISAMSIHFRISRCSFFRVVQFDIQHHCPIAYSPLCAICFVQPVAQFALALLWGGSPAYKEGKGCAHEWSTAAHI